MQDECLALTFGEPGERVRQQDCLLVSLSVLAGRGLLAGQPVAEPGRRLFHLLFKRSFAGDVALLPALRAEGIGHVTCQDSAKPRRVLLTRRAPKLVALLESLHERLLHDVGGIDAAGRARSELDPRQKPQVIAKPLETTGFRKTTCAP